MFLGSGDKPHVSYSKDNSGDKELVYQEKTSGSWSGAEVVDCLASDDFGVVQGMGIDSSDDVHILYDQVVSGSDDYLRYATGTTGSFTKSSPNTVTTALSRILHLEISNSPQSLAKESP